MLTDRLRRAERAGLLTAAAYQHRPRRYVYELTAAGDELAAIMPALSAWSAASRRLPCPAPRPLRDTAGAALVVPGVRRPGRRGDADVWL